MAINEKQKTEISQTEPALEQQLAWYKSFFEHAAEAVMIVEPRTWSVLDANEHAVQLLEKPKKSIIGMEIPKFRRIYKLLQKSTAPLILSEISYDVSPYRTIMLEISARLLNHKGNDLILAIARDVSEQDALTYKLVQADKLVLLGQLTASVAHEIRNPLAAVNLNLQLLKRSFDESSSEYNYVISALEGVDRIIRIVDVTLNYTKPTLPDIQEINANAVIKSSIDLVSAAINRKGIKLDLKLTEKMPLIAVDIKQIQQVLINIITNAADSIRENGHIQIKTFVEHNPHNDELEYSVIQVIDNGIGISSEDLPKVFNPFFTRKSDGVGLGLPITQRIIHQHGGVIDVESTLGKGTSIYIKLPIPLND